MDLCVNWSQEITSGVMPGLRNELKLDNNGFLLLFSSIKSGAGQVGVERKSYKYTMHADMVNRS